MSHSESSRCPVWFLFGGLFTYLIFTYLFQELKSWDNLLNLLRDKLCVRATIHLLLKIWRGRTVKPLASDIDGRLIQQNMEQPLFIFLCPSRLIIWGDECIESFAAQDIRKIQKTSWDGSMLGLRFLGCMNLCKFQRRPGVTVRSFSEFLWVNDHNDHRGSQPLCWAHLPWETPVIVDS